MTPILVLIAVLLIIIILKLVNNEHFSVLKQSKHQEFIKQLSNKMDVNNPDSNLTNYNLLNLIKSQQISDKFLDDTDSLPKIINNNLEEYIHELKVLNNKKIIRQKWKNMAVLKYKLYNILDTLEDVNNFDLKKLRKLKNHKEVFHKDHYIKNNN